MNSLCAAVLTGLILFCCASRVQAQDVTLTSLDGEIEITGELLAFDGEYYRIDTKFGELTIDGSGVVCAGVVCPNLRNPVTELSLSGSAKVAERLLPALVDDFARANRLEVARVDKDDLHFTLELADPAQQRLVARFSVRATNTDEGFADLLAYETDLVMALREMRAEEAFMIEEAGFGDLTERRQARVLALDAVVPIVSPQNPVTQITPAQLAGIFTGQITDWSQIGGPAGPISMHMPDAGSGLAQIVQQAFARLSDLGLSPDIQRHVSGLSMTDNVVSDPFAIAMASLADVDTARVLELTGECGIAVPVTRRTIKADDYPLTAPVYLYLPQRRLPEIGRSFLDYVDSRAAQFVIRRAGFIDQLPEETPLAPQGDRLINAVLAAGPDTQLRDLQRLLTSLSPMRRLSMSVRFDPVSSQPDALSRSNLRLLAKAMNAGIYDGMRLMFAGFTDATGSAAQNRQIAKDRANLVRREVTQFADIVTLDRVSIDVDAFAEAMPLACEDSQWGRHVNNRVEIWVQ